MKAVGTKSQRYVNRLTTGASYKKGACGYQEGYTVLPNGMELQDYYYGRGEYMMYLYEQGMSYQDIAKKVGGTRQNVQQQLKVHHKRVKNLVSRIAGLLDLLV